MNAAYEAGKRRRIMQNARVGRQKKFAERLGTCSREFVAWLMSGGDRQLGMVPDFLRNGLAEWGSLTEKQLECAMKIYDERVERAAKRELENIKRQAEAPHWVAGRQTVTGTIEYAAYRTHGPHATTTVKASMVLADGRKLWTSIPRKPNGDLTAPEDLRDLEITMTVTVTPKENDPTMAFGSRPVFAKEG